MWPSNKDIPHSTFHRGSHNYESPCKLITVIKLFSVYSAVMMASSLGSFDECRLGTTTKPHLQHCSMSVIGRWHTPRRSRSCVRSVARRLVTRATWSSIDASTTTAATSTVRSVANDCRRRPISVVICSFTTPSESSRVPCADEASRRTTTLSATSAYTATTSRTCAPSVAGRSTEPRTSRCTATRTLVSVTAVTAICPSAIHPGFPCLLETPGCFLKLPGPGKSQKNKVMHFSSCSNEKKIWRPYVNKCIGILMSTFCFLHRYHYCLRHLPAEYTLYMKLNIPNLRRHFILPASVWQQNPVIIHIQHEWNCISLPADLRLLNISLPAFRKRLKMFLF